MPDLEQRVNDLEQKVQELRHLAETGAPSGVAFGLSLVRDEVAELRRETRAGFAAVNTRFDAVDGRLDEVAGQVGEIRDALQQLLDRN